MSLQLSAHQESPCSKCGTDSFAAKRILNVSSTNLGLSSLGDDGTIPMNCSILFEDVSWFIFDIAT